MNPLNSSLILPSEFENIGIDDAVSIAKTYRDKFASGIRVRANESSFEHLLEIEKETFLEVNQAIEKYQKKYEENVDLYFICEMALRYLEKMHELESEVKQ